MATQTGSGYLVSEAVRKVIGDAVGAEIGSAHIKKVVLRPMTDEEAARESFQVYLIFEGRVRDFDARRALDVTRMMRAKIRSAGEDRTPIFSFVTTSEAKENKIEAA